MNPQPLIETQELSKEFKVGNQSLLAVQHLNLSIYPGEILSLVGESGCGKSTVGRLLLRLYEPTQGEVLFKGRNLGELTRTELKHTRRDMQMIFQDPFGSLNPRLTIQDIVGEPLEIHRLGTKQERKERIVQLLELVGLEASHLSRFPHEFSGGQRQRIGIARALASNPQFLVCDEPISALDVSIQAQVINLLRHLQQTMGLTYLFIAHDLAIVKYLSTRVAVMYLGQIMELAPAETLYQAPQHPYTQALLSCIPIPNPTLERARKHLPIRGEVPNPLHPPTGCPFVSRCPLARPECKHLKPKLKEIAPHHFVACHLL